MTYHVVKGTCPEEWLTAYTIHGPQWGEKSKAQEFTLPTATALARIIAQHATPYTTFHVKEINGTHVISFVSSSTV